MYRKKKEKAEEEEKEKVESMARKEIIAGNDISKLLTLSLNGYEQKVLIEGKKKDLPIVLTLHGGPGNPIPFSIGCRGLFPEFTEKFLMVYWDQLGCGINNCEIDGSFSIDTFVRMTEDLLHKLREMFPGNRMIMFSASWGSILSAKVLEKNPQIVDGVVACGQIIKHVFLCADVLETLEKSNVPRKKLEAIKKISLENYTGKDLQNISSSLRKYTNAYIDKNGEQPPMGIMMKGLLTSPDYKFRDVIAIMVNGYRKNTTLWKEILGIDLTETLNQVEVPYLMLQGDTDIVASTKTVQELAATSENKNLFVRVIPNAGHFPGTAMMDALLSALEEIACGNNVRL